MGEHAMQPVDDRVGATEVVGNAMGAEADEEVCEPLVVTWVAPGHRRVVGEPARVRVAVRLVVEEDTIEE